MLKIEWDLYGGKFRARNLKKSMKDEVDFEYHKRVVLSSSAAGMSGSYDNPVVPLWREVRDLLERVGEKP